MYSFSDDEDAPVVRNINLSDSDDSDDDLPSLNAVMGGAPAAAGSPPPRPELEQASPERGEYLLSPVKEALSFSKPGSEDSASEDEDEKSPTPHIKPYSGLSSNTAGVAALPTVRSCKRALTWQSSDDEEEDALPPKRTRRRVQPQASPDEGACAGEDSPDLPSPGKQPAAATTPRPSYSLSPLRGLSGGRENDEALMRAREMVWETDSDDYEAEENVLQSAGGRGALSSPGKWELEEGDGGNIVTESALSHWRDRLLKTHDVTSHKMADYVTTEFTALASGAFGSVWRARRRDSGEEFALKLIEFALPAGKGKLESSKGTRKDIEREISLHWRARKHANVARLHGVATDARASQIVLVMELYTLSLRDYIDLPTYTPTLTDVRRKIGDALRGVAFIHTKNICHRDIKPENLLLDNTGRVCIADFGHARGTACRDSSAMSPRKGTGLYRGPEAILGHFPSSSPDLRPLDVWALGCVLAEMADPSLGHPFGAQQQSGGGWGSLVQEDGEGVLKAIFRLRGTPAEVTWPGATRCAGYREGGYRRQVAKDEGEHFKKLAESSAHVLFKEMTTLNPSARVTARDAIGHKFFALDLK